MDVVCSVPPSRPAATRQPANNVRSPLSKSNANHAAGDSQLVEDLRTEVGPLGNIILFHCAWCHDIPFRYSYCHSIIPFLWCSLFKYQPILFCSLSATSSTSHCVHCRVTASSPFHCVDCHSISPFFCMFTATASSPFVFTVTVSSPFLYVHCHSIIPFCVLCHSIIAIIPFSLCSLSQHHPLFSVCTVTVSSPFLYVHCDSTIPFSLCSLSQHHPIFFVFTVTAPFSFLCVHCHIIPFFWCSLS